MYYFVNFSKKQKKVRNVIYFCYKKFTINNNRSISKLNFKFFLEIEENLNSLIFSFYAKRETPKQFKFKNK